LYTHGVQFAPQSLRLKEKLNREDLDHHPHKLNSSAGPPSLSARACAECAKIASLGTALSSRCPMNSACLEQSSTCSVIWLSSGKWAVSQGTCQRVCNAIIASWGCFKRWRRTSPSSALWTMKSYVYSVPCLKGIYGCCFITEWPLDLLLLEFSVTESES
jgi:hypothetical protein